jgi:hypothetical protein
VGAKIGVVVGGMESLPSVSDRELLARMPRLVGRERMASAEVIGHLMEIDRRQLYLGEGCSSLFSYCRERLGYSEDEALKRLRVARLGRRVPAVLEELRSGAVHLTGLFVLSHYMTEENAEALLAEARGKSRRELERALARLFPRGDVAQRIVPLGAGGAGTSPGAGDRGERGRLEALSASRFRVEFTASGELYEKIERARELLSHSVPSGDLEAVFERALDALIASEMRRRTGAGKRRKARALGEGSRHVPVEVARVVWERDGARCAFVDAEGRRCTERKFLTLEHRVPHALGGASTVENVCLLCAGHNRYTAREVFGVAYVEQKRTERVETAERAERAMNAPERARSALWRLGFGRAEVARVLETVAAQSAELDAAALVRAALVLLTPTLSCA